MSKAKPPSRSRAAIAYTGDFDTADFIIPASDSKGHSERANFRFPVAMAREISVTLASRLFPFQDASDVHRFCLWLGLKYLRELTDVPNSVWGQAEAAKEIAREVLFQKQYEETFRVLEEAFERLRTYGGASALGQRKALYAKVQANFQAMPDGFWKTHYLAQLAQRFLHEVQGPRPADSGGSPDRLGYGRRQEDVEDAG